MLPRCHAQVWPMLGRGVIRESEDAKTPLCTIWRYDFARSRRDLTICVAEGGACSSGFLFRSPRARAGTHANAKLVTLRIGGAFQYCFASQSVNVRSLKLEGDAFRRTELAHLTKIERSAALEVQSTSLLAKHRCRRGCQRCHAQVWHLFQRGVSGESEDAKTPLCTTWMYGLARSWRDLTICGVKGGACSNRFLFRKAAS